MPDIALPQKFRLDEPQREEAIGSGARFVHNVITVSPVILSVALVVVLIWHQRFVLLSLQAAGVPALAMLVVALLLSLMPVYVCFVHNVTRNRQMRKLDSLTGFPVADTAYFRAARLSVQTAGINSVGADYFASISVYATLLMIGFSLIALGLVTPGALRIPNVVLGGWQSADSVLAGAADAPGAAALAKLADYQTKTFVVMATAFIGAYVYSLNRLLDRINNNDLYPISLYYHTVRAIIAVFSAAVLRHAASTFLLPDTSSLILIGFVVGMAPDSFILAMMRRAFQAVKITAVREDPEAKPPAALPLLTIDDLSRDKIDRLNELGIDNAQVFSRQNPFMLWPRLPYDLTLIVDWIGQAHLYTLLKDARLAAAREKLVRDTFDLQLRLADEKARPPISEALGLDEAEVASLLLQLNKDPTFVRLKQVREALAQ